MLSERRDRLNNSEETTKEIFRKKLSEKNTISDTYRRTAKKTFLLQTPNRTEVEQRKMLSETSITSATEMRSTQDLVLTVHGFGSKKLYMRPLCHRLKNNEFRVENWGYSSVFGDVRASVDRLTNFITETAKTEPRIHVVAHSMGSLIVRSALSRLDAETQDRVGNVVLLAPPNGGSPIASALAPLLSWLIPPLHDLSTARTSLVHAIPKTDPAKFGKRSVPIGVIAARWDILVPRQSTVLENAADYIVFPATHNSLLVSKRTANAVVSFLRNQMFRINDSLPNAPGASTCFSE